jgi:hypothetical protein
MKKSPLFILIFLMLFSCKSSEIDPTSIVGKWAFTGITQSQNADGTWTPWHVNQIFCIRACYPDSYEFTSDGRYLTDGKPGASCCYAGNKYSLYRNMITFSELLNCPTVKCVKCDFWVIDKVDADTLILNQCYFKNKYVRII